MANDGSKSLTSIVSTEVRLVRIPVDPPHGDAIQKFTALELPLVILEDRQGNRGVGFSYTIGSGGTTVVELLKAELLPRLIGQDGAEISYVGKFLQDAIHALTPGCIASLGLSAIDIALWDLAGKRLGQPVHILLGGAQRSVPVYNTDVGWLSRPLDEMLDRSREAVSSGKFKALKLKVGKPSAEEDRERVARVRETVGPQIALMVDANQSWSLPEAVKRARMLEPYDLVFLEEPMPAGQLDDFAHLQQHTSLALAGGESIYSKAEFFQCLRMHALSILQPDIARIGGITPAMAVCALAECAGVNVAPHVSPELSVVVACAVPNSIFIEYIPTMQRILKKPLHIENGRAFPSIKPGLGIEFNWDEIDKLGGDHGQRNADGGEAQSSGGNASSQKEGTQAARSR